MASTHDRGYGYEHQRMRRALLPSMPGSSCTRCGKTLREGDKVDLDHNDDRTGYLGFSHASCNRSAGGRKAHQMAQAGSGAPSLPVARWSRDWLGEGPGSPHFAWRRARG